ncbi:hypothetical protein [Ruminococcus sp.]|uniref:hypothetical protein n=1 Tax=Ruminococcus sp. TaxID=41978 RepID=UPI0025F860B3|nr:hypothetical protein [Ruminococcus sp.]
MIKVTDLQEMNRIENTALQVYIREKAETMLQEYQVENLDEIGCFVLLEQSEIQHFVVSEMEFVELFEIGEKTYLHGVKIIDDSYGEDIFLPVEAVRC